MTRFNNSKLFHLCYIYCTKVPVCTYVLYTVQHSFLYGGFPGGRGGVRYTITVKISTEKASPKQCIRRVESYLKDRKKSTKRAIKTRWPYMHSLFAFYSSLYLFSPVSFIPQSSYISFLVPLPFLHHYSPLYPFPSSLLFSSLSLISLFPLISLSYRYIFF